jgi:hypothetical protein
LLQSFRPESYPPGMWIVRQMQCLALRVRAVARRRCA